MRPNICAPAKPFEHLRPQPNTLRALGSSPQADIRRRRTVLIRLATAAHPSHGR
ncbi:hypothetical protein [Micrococcus sp.]|uniref:hypothetical protein n=1 Tax=Micrococcus sp. TaxID=1271 RepID=UPI0026DDCA7C|nr:hypothetical protein [Micrococcus sp.]MDO4239913.1 hypothetical protein [Micrococcus sp.]